MDRAQFQLARFDQVGDAHALRPGIGKIELAGDTALEDVQMRRQREVRLHDMQVVDPRRIYLGQFRRQVVGMLLVVAFDADLVARLQHRFEQGHRLLRRDDLAVGQRPRALNPRCLVAGKRIPPARRRARRCGRIQAGHDPVPSASSISWLVIFHSLSNRET